MPLDERPEGVSIAFPNAGHELAFGVSIGIPVEARLGPFTVAFKCPNRMRITIPGRKKPRTRAGGNPPQHAP